jgi:MoxR-like ATPase
MMEINADELRKCITADMLCRNASMITSSPGMGKSDIVRQIAAKGVLKIIDLRVSQCEPVDMQGYPGVIDGRMTFHTPEYFPLETDELPLIDENPKADPEGPRYNGWILFLDEFNSGNKQTEAAAYKLVLDREVYKHKLHSMCFIVAAGNLITDRAIVNQQSPATTSRMSHYRLKIDHNMWIDWAHTHEIDHRIISLIKFKPSLLHMFDPAKNDLTFPCPRTWAFASKIVLGQDKIDRIDSIRLAGTIGEGAAAEFRSYSQIYMRLPTIEQILNDPLAGWTVPTEASEQYAITTMFSHNISEANIDKMILAIGRLPMEMQVVTFKDIYKRAIHLKKHPAIEEWVATHASKLFGN